MKECAENGSALKYYDSISRSHSGPETVMTNATSVPKQSLSEKALKSILIDESHGELLCSRPGNDSELDSWSLLGESLKETFGWTVSSHKADDGTLTRDMLQLHDVLVLGAPTSVLLSDENDAIASFVRQGKAVLIANSYESLWRQGSICSINSLLERFGLRTQQLVSAPQKQVSSFRPHYISSEIYRLAIREPTYLKQLNDKSQVIANLPEINEPFLATVEVGSGRVAAIGDFALFGDRYIAKDDNQAIALNIFRWLTRQNVLDFADVTIAPEVKFGKQAMLSLNLSTPHRKGSLKNVQCFLTSDQPTWINHEHFTVHSVRADRKKCVNWLIEPQKLGPQRLTLKIDPPDSTDCESLYFEQLTQFVCIPDAELDLIFLSEQEKVQEVETGSVFEAKGLVRWNQNAKEVSLKFELESPPYAMGVEQISNGYWRLTPQKPGTHKLKLKVEETGQTITRLIHVLASAQTQIEELERDIVGLLAAKVHHYVSQIWPELGTDKMRDIPFRLLTPENFVYEVYPRQTRERLLEVLRVARSDVEQFLPIVDELLLYITPTYIPKIGCCIPFDPKLAAHLAVQYPTREIELAYSLLGIEGDDRYGQNWMEGNIVALLLHEKYGHGFFHTSTISGQQLTLLQQHKLLRRVDYEELTSPYLRSLHEQYAEVIRMLDHSNILVNEGFAAWVELTGLKRLGKPFDEVFHRRKEFMFQDTQLEQAVDYSEYFRQFPPGSGSQYQIMYDFLVRIQGFVNPDISAQYALQAMVKATSVDFGITEQNAKIQFGLSAQQMQDRLLDDTKGLESGPDMRLRYIWKALADYHQSEDVADCTSSDLHINDLVNTIVAETIGW